MSRKLLWLCFLIIKVLIRIFFSLYYFIQKEFFKSCDIYYILRRQNQKKSLESHQNALIFPFLKYEFTLLYRNPFHTFKSLQKRSFLIPPPKLFSSLHLSDSAATSRDIFRIAGKNGGNFFLLSRGEKLWLYFNLKLMRTG